MSPNPFSRSRRPVPLSVDSAELEALSPAALRTLGEVSAYLLRLTDSELGSGIHFALRSLASLYGVDRVQLLELSSESAVWDVAHQWPRRSTAEPEQTAPPMRHLPWLLPQLRQGRSVAIVRTGDLTSEALEERKWLDEQSVCSTFIAPLLRDSELLGALTLDTLTDERDWALGVLPGLSALAEVLASAVERQRAGQALQMSQDWLQLAQQAGRAVVWDWNVTTDGIHFSKSAVNLFGVSESQVPTTGEALMRMIPETDQELIHDALRATLRGKGSYVTEHRVVLPTGNLWLAVRGQLFHRDTGAHILGVSTDITEHRRAEEELQREQARAQVTLASIGDGVIRTDPEGRVDYLNPVAETLTGYLSHEAQGRPLDEIYTVIDESTRQPRGDSISHCLDQEKVVLLAGPSLLLSRDGTEYAVRDSVAPIRDAQGLITGAVLVTQDVSKLRALEREMTYLARHDPLTGLINRREFEAELVNALDEAHRGGRHHALCYLDLDEFKVVNDTCGHVAGDELLRQLTAVLDAAVRESDVLARLGGDEFGVLLRNCTSASAVDVAQKLCATVRQFRFTWEHRLFNVGASIGIVPLTATSGSLDQVLSAADAACYVAKERGRGRVHLYQADDEALARRHGEMQWVERIHNAFANHRFRLYRQPIQRISAPDGPISGSQPSPTTPPMAEVLLRMLDEQDEPIAAAAFIAAAERYHLIGQIDRWVVERGLTALAADPDDTVYTLNLSGHSLGDARFLSFVERVLTETAVDPARLCFEITETAAITNLNGARRLISTLRARGCRFVLDDFGTGLSSFAYLRTLAVDFLKIDGEFVRHMVNDPVERALVGSIDQIGHLLGLETIAESVEDESTLRALADLGVDYGQGYHVGRPEPWPAADRD
ncbi:MAG: EAL domain-containing protein [Thermoanaerobaculia bacterium]|nr:EAL domain-containing protein [Thermoanaerobaculia bacterium]